MKGPDGPSNFFLSLVMLTDIRAINLTPGLRDEIWFLVKAGIMVIIIIFLMISNFFKRIELDQFSLRIFSIRLRGPSRFF